MGTLFHMNLVLSDFKFTEKVFSKNVSHLFYKVLRPAKNKTIELEVYKFNTIFEFTVNARTKQDHAGITFTLGFMGVILNIDFYDNRHWDYKTNSYEKYKGEDE